ncbi:hypothetical protein [Methanoregula sp.]|uniref:hypothetical protein n=1 Tax=Methanoregula sp. TaxID=2052170 RepID=UPI0035699A2A
MACICYKTSSGKASHPIQWIAVASFPRTEPGFHAALKEESHLIDSPFAHRIIKARDDDCQRVWLVQQCHPWACCLPENT